MAGTAMLTPITKIEDIGKAIERLSVAELAEFRAWFEEFDERGLDEKIERNAKAGKLDKLMAEARSNCEASPGQHRGSHQVQLAHRA